MKYIGKQQGHPFPEAHPFGKWNSGTASPLETKRRKKAKAKR